MQKAVEYARKRKGPALVHARVIRPYSHSLSEDEALYRPKEERAADAARDPVTQFPKWLAAEGLATPAALDTIEAEIMAIVADATEKALAAAQPGPETMAMISASMVSSSAGVA